MFVKRNGVTRYPWRAVQREGEVLEVFVSKRRDSPAAVKFLRKAMKRYGYPKTIVSDRLRSYGAALNDLTIRERHQTGGELNNWAENSGQSGAASVT